MKIQGEGAPSLVPTSLVTTHPSGGHPRNAPEGTFYSFFKGVNELPKEPFSIVYLEIQSSNVEGKS